MPAKRIDESIIHQIDYLSSQGYSSKDIAVQVNCSTATVRRYRSGKNVSICRTCGNKNPVGSKYCNECGKPILTEAEYLCKRLQDLFRLEPSLQENAVQGFHDTIRDAMKYIKGSK